MSGVLRGTWILWFIVVRGLLDDEVPSHRCFECADLLGIRKKGREPYAEFLERHQQWGCEANYQGSNDGIDGASVSQDLSSVGRLFAVLEGDTKNDIRTIAQSRPYADLPTERKHGGMPLPDRSTIGKRGD